MEPNGRASCPISVDAASISWAIPTCWISLGVTIAFGLGTLMANATNIERNGLVGGMTLLGALLGAMMLQRALDTGGPSSWFQVAAICLVGSAFFFLGWLLDFSLGPLPLNREADEETLGAHLSD